MYVFLSVCVCVCSGVWLIVWASSQCLSLGSIKVCRYIETPLLGFFLWVSVGVCLYVCLGGAGLWVYIHVCAFFVCVCFEFVRVYVFTRS